MGPGIENSLKCSREVYKRFVGERARGERNRWGALGLDQRQWEVLAERFVENAGRDVQAGAAGEHQQRGRVDGDEVRSSRRVLSVFVVVPLQQSDEPVDEVSPLRLHDRLQAVLERLVVLVTVVEFVELLHGRASSLGIVGDEVSKCLDVVQDVLKAPVAPFFQVAFVVEVEDSLAGLLEEALILSEKGAMTHLRERRRPVGEPRGCHFVPTFSYHVVERTVVLDGLRKPPDGIIMFFKQ